MASTDSTLDPLIVLCEVYKITNMFSFGDMLLKSQMSFLTSYLPIAISFPLHG